MPSSASRASALASAALASSRLTQTYPRATPLPSSSQIVLPPQRASRKGKERAWQAPEEEEEEGGYSLSREAEEVPLSSRLQRLSRAARFGSSYSSTPISLPFEWNIQVNDMVKASDVKTLRQDYLRYKRDDDVGNKPHHVKNGHRASMLHLTTSSPSRYSSLFSVLSQLRTRLGPDEEGIGDRDSHWSPRHIIEYNCASAEGLWAAAKVFGSGQDQKDGNVLATYTGYDERVPLLRAANSIVTSARESMRTTLGQDPPISDDFSALQHIGLRLKPSPAAEEASNVVSPSFEERRPASTLDSRQTTEGDTMVVCSYVLSSKANDKARKRFVNNIWSDHPEAEVIVFVEKGDEKGFACIASARERLLGLEESTRSSGKAMQIGGRTFYDESAIEDGSEEAEDVDESRVQCHVVAPCPHDKACPLLHDFQFAEPLSIPITRTSAASSPLFHGAAIGMNTCSFPQRIHLPEYTKRTSHMRRGDESSRYSYLVVKRGPRPSVQRRAHSLSIDDSEQFLQMSQDIRRGADRTKIGEVEQIRAGSKAGDVPYAEEVDADLEEDDETSRMTAEDMDEPLARQELMNLLPDVLKRQMDANKDEESDLDEATRLAQDMMRESAALADSGTEQSEEAAEDDTALAAAFLAQARQLGSGGEQLESESPKEVTLDAHDIESMRIEAYQWPRLVRSAMKKSGHVTFDVCSCEGSIDRFTVSKARGKQVYQDARKSNHGDIFPHIPFSDEEGTRASIKSLVTRVPAASTERGSLAPTFKSKKSPATIKVGPISSADAIAPDRIVESRSTVPDRTLSDSASKTAKTRRAHYVRGQGKDRRDSRKKSLDFYDRFSTSVDAAPMAASTAD